MFAAENRALKDLIEKKLQGCARNAKLVAEYKLPLQSSCRCNGLSRAAYYKNPIHTDRDAEVIKALNPLIESPSTVGVLDVSQGLKAKDIRGTTNAYIAFTALSG